jgi:preprotein translocase subunit SecA
VIYAQREQVLSTPDLREQVLRMVKDQIRQVVTAHTPGPDPEDWDLRGLHSELRTFFPLPPDFNYRRWEELASDETEAQLFEVAERAYDDINRSIGHDIFRQAAREDMTLGALAQSADPANRLVYQRVVDQLGKEPDEDVLARPIRRLPDQMKPTIEAALVDAYRLFRDRQLMLRAVDGLWVRHLTDPDARRDGIGLRAYGQQNPLVAYRKEAHEMYEALLGRIQETVARTAYLVPRTLVTQPRQQRLQAMRRDTPTGRRQARPTQDKPRKSLGRNDPCWCGSGKKYKYCHMRQDMEEQRMQGAAGVSGRKRRRQR